MKANLSLWLVSVRFWLRSHALSDCLASTRDAIFDAKSGSDAMIRSHTTLFSQPHSRT